MEAKNQQSKVNFSFSELTGKSWPEDKDFLYEVCDSLVSEDGKSKNLGGEILKAMRNIADLCSNHSAVTELYGDKKFGTSYLFLLKVMDGVLSKDHADCQLFVKNSWKSVCDYLSSDDEKFYEMPSCECENMLSDNIPEENIASVLVWTAFLSYRVRLFGLHYDGDVKIPYGVTKIDDGAFWGHRGLTSIEIPDSVTEIGASAFWGCHGLTRVEIPNSVTEIGKDAFANCYNLTSIVIPDSVTKIGKRAFYGCPGLTSIVIPGSVTEIEWATFSECSGLSSIIIPDSVTEIGSSAFGECVGLTNIEIPGSVTEIGKRAFSGCSGLTSIVIPDSVKVIGEQAFYRCSGLTSIQVSEDNKYYSSKGNCLLSKDGKVLYCGCKTSIIPSGVTEIGDYAFYKYNAFTGLEISSGVTKIGYSAFCGSGSLTSIVVSEGNEYYSSKDNCLLSKDGKTLYCGCESSIIPAGVIRIELHAFEGCSGLTSILIPSSVTEIGEQAFSGCSGLADIQVSEDNENYSSKDNCLLSKDGKVLYCGCKTSIIPAFVTEIKNYAFEGCSDLNRIEIPESVTKIGYGVFDGCTNLDSITVKGPLFLPPSLDFAPNAHVYYEKAPFTL